MGGITMIKDSILRALKGKTETEMITYCANDLDICPTDLGGTETEEDLCSDRCDASCEVCMAQYFKNYKYRVEQALSAETIGMISADEAREMAMSVNSSNSFVAVLKEIKLAVRNASASGFFDTETYVVIPENVAQQVVGFMQERGYECYMYFREHTEDYCIVTSWERKQS